MSEKEGGGKIKKRAPRQTSASEAGRKKWPTETKGVH